MLQKILFAFFSLGASYFHCKAQPITSGKIQIERVINLQKQSNEPSYLEQLRKENLFFKRDTFSLQFNEHGSLYNKLGSDNQALFFNVPGLNNKVLHEFDNQTWSAEKEVFDQFFIVNDTGYGAKWKYTGEIREIAGHECKRAETILFDSIYVVAFYAIDVLGTSGPESFHGLPGMILGLAIPRLNTTWFATKVEKADIDLPGIPIEKKGVRVNTPELKRRLEASKMNWGLNGSRYLIWAVI